MQATEEQIEKVGKAIFLGLLVEQEWFEERYLQYKEQQKLEEFVKILYNAIDSVWNGTNDEDKMEKEKYTTLAKLALKASGFAVTITTQPYPDVLV